MTHLYHYNEQGLYIHKSEARMSPRGEENTPLVPRNATLLEPPKTKTHEIAKFEDGYWTMLPDYRGYRYWTPDEGETGILEVGINPPDDEIPMAESDRLIQNEYGTWRRRSEADDLSEYRRNKISELKLRCDLETQADFDCSALGTDHKYSGVKQSIDLIAYASILTKDYPALCDDMKGNEDSKQMREHTQDQSRVVLEEFMVTIELNESIFYGLKDEVMAAKDEAEIDAIEW